MPLLIDAYNVLHAEKPARLAGLDLAGLCRLLARTPWCRERIYVVCDGQPGALGLAASPVPEVELVYSGSGRTADAVMMAMIAEDTAPRRLVVVSTDREIRRAARRRRARTWTSEQFLRHLAEALRRSGTGDVRDKPVDPQLDPRSVEAWLAEFGFEIDRDVQRELDADEDDESKYWPPW